jgi:glutamyl-tRNA synthetase
MATKDELTASIKSVGDEIREMKASKASSDLIMAKVGELKELKATFEKVTGAPFDPPKEGKSKKDKKEDKSAAPSGSDASKGPSKNELKKLAKASKKDAKRAEYKAQGSEATPQAQSNNDDKKNNKKKDETKLVSSLELPPPSSGKIHRSVTATSDLFLTMSSMIFDGATLFYHPLTSMVTAYSLSLSMNHMSGLKLVKNNPKELPRLVFNGKQIIGDHAIARFILSSTSCSINKEQDEQDSILNQALSDQWLDLAYMFCGDELPFLTLLDEHLSSNTFLTSSIEGTSPGMADIACYACLSLPGNQQQKNIEKQININRWMASINGSKVLKQIKSVLSGEIKPPPSKRGTSSTSSLSSSSLSSKKQDDKDTSAATASSNDNDDSDMGGGCPPLEGAIDGQVVTRFPPEPSGFLHIGHAKAVLLNEYYARHYHGKLLVRFDDTNPSKEKEEFESNILRDLESLEIKPDAISHSSDHFDKCQELAKKLIKDGHAFMDDTSQEIMQEERRNKIESKNRNQKPDVALSIFEKFAKGDSNYTHYCLRVKLDMSSENGTLRDPVLYRYNATPHHRTGTKYKIYPTYDFVCPIVDAIEGVTHCLRTTEYNDRDIQYHQLQKLMNLRHVKIHAFAKLNFVSTMLSKRKLQWFVDNKIVPNWDDPRFPTIQGVVRRGVTMKGLRNFIYAQGASRNIVLQEWDKFWSLNKDEYEPTAPRYHGVAANSAVKFHLSGADVDFNNDTILAKSVPLIPSEGENGKHRPLRLSKTVYLEHEDAQDCNEGDLVILLFWGVCEVTKVVKDKKTNKVISLSGIRKPDTSVKKIKKKFNFVADTKDILKATVIEYDHLITKPKIEEGENFQDFINPLSMGEMPILVEPALKSLIKGDIIQLVRRGFFRVDQPHISEQEPLKLIFIPDGKAKSMSTLSTALPHR